MFQWEKTVKKQTAACTRPKERKVEWDLRQKVYGAWNVYGTGGGQDITALMKGSGCFSKHGQDSGERGGEGKSKRSGCSPNHHSF